MRSKRCVKQFGWKILRKKVAWVARPLPTQRTTKTQNKRIKASMPWVGFEPTIPALELAKIVHALDGAATVMGEEI
jgi:hypothetical protein